MIPLLGIASTIVVDWWYAWRMDELWKEIPNSDYSVSNLGRVASRKKGGWRVLRPKVHKQGYLNVGLCSGGVLRTFLVHRLVAEAFLGPKPSPKHEINHKSGIKSDERAVNLEWVTPSENRRHCFDVLGQKLPRGRACGRAKVTEADVREIRRRRAAGESCVTIAADYGVHKTNVHAIFIRRSWAWLV